MKKVKIKSWFSFVVGIFLSVLYPLGFSRVFAQNWCVGNTCVSTNCPNHFWELFGELSSCGHCITLGHLRCFTGAFIGFLITLAFVYAVIRIIIAGIQYSAAIGNPDKQTEAKKALIWSVIGIVVAFSAYAILSLILRSIPVGDYIP